VPPQHISRWDLDKTYLRTEFDTVRDLVRTAFERAHDKRTHPGAATLLRELGASNVAIYILSGSPEQMRRKLEEKLRLDGIRWEAFTLKPNLQNMLRLRFRALRDQLGYKLPELLASRTKEREVLDGVTETLFGDDAEADAFVYALYADIMEGRATAELVQRILERGRVYEDVIEAALANIRRVAPAPVVERIFIHLEQQKHPRDFDVFAGRIVPFYNYLQPAFMLHESGRILSRSLLRVAAEMVTHHRFDGDAMARSYADMVRRGHLQGAHIDALESALDDFEKGPKSAAKDEVRRMVRLLPPIAERAREAYKPLGEQPMPDYLSLVERHNPRHKKRHR
jgi:hypothetical protein